MATRKRKAVTKSDSTANTEFGEPTTYTDFDLATTDEAQPEADGQPDNPLIAGAEAFFKCQQPVGDAPDEGDEDHRGICGNEIRVGGALQSEFQAACLCGRTYHVSISHA